MRILDLGCGSGKTLKLWQIAPSDEVTGVDIDPDALAIAKTRFPQRTFLLANGEALPFADRTFDRVVSTVSLPYMKIAKALAEIHRVLVPQGQVSLSLHSLHFTLGELRNAFPKPVATLYRLFVLVNGALFYAIGRTWGESFQSERGMRLAFKRAGLAEPSFRQGLGRNGPWFIAEARREPRLSAAVSPAAPATGRPTPVA